ncbi:MAG: T9SS type A sorting domain-containing protein, partial [Bacteroidota bacterium]
NYSYSKTIKLVPNSIARGIWLQTNPVANELALVNNAQAMIQHIAIADMSGRIINDKPVNNNSTLIKVNTYSLLPGFYLVRVFTSNGSNTLPLIKQ